MKTLLKITAGFLLLTGCGSGKPSDAPLSMVVSADKMNVIYVGVDNPISIAVNGVAQQDISVKMDDGKIEGKDGHYTVAVGAAGSAKIDVFAKMANGENQHVGTAIFRAKLVPDPIANFAGHSSTAVNTAISMAEIQSAEGVNAMMVNFDFDLKFEVVSFDLTMAIGGIEVSEKSTGPSLSPAQKMILAKAKTGSKIYIENIKVKGPDGATRTIAPIVVKVI